MSSENNKIFFTSWKQKETHLLVNRSCEYEMLRASRKILKGRSCQFTISQRNWIPQFGTSDECKTDGILVAKFMREHSWRVFSTRTRYSIDNENKLQSRCTLRNVNYYIASARWSTADTRIGEGVSFFFFFLFIVRFPLLEFLDTEKEVVRKSPQMKNSNGSRLFAEFQEWLTVSILWTGVVSPVAVRWRIV